MSAELRLLHSSTTVEVKRRKSPNNAEDESSSLERNRNEATEVGESAETDGEIFTDRVEEIEKSTDLIEDWGAANYQKVARSLQKVRQERQPGSELRLTLDKLRGNLLSSSDLRDLLLYSLVGGTGSSKPKWCHFRPWKRTSQTILIRVNCGDSL
uniref:Uncharacterized protein n=1 Tax=Plectus sambesii TaxID=2011161 RepID=A0A914V520_9BILA